MVGEGYRRRVRAADGRRGLPTRARAADGGQGLQTEGKGRRRTRAINGLNKSGPGRDSEGVPYDLRQVDEEF